MSDDKPSDPEKTEPVSDESEDSTADEQDTDTAEQDTEADSSPAASKEAPREKRTGKKKRLERERAAAAEAAKKSTGNSLLFGVLGLAAGAAVGWFGHIAQAKAKLKTDTTPPPALSGSAGPPKAAPCAALEKEICGKLGDISAACAQAKAAATLLTSGTCELALDTVPMMLEKSKAARAGCDALVARLCKDIGPESGACAMVKERTPGFAPERCVELTQNYEQVLGELKQMEQRGMIPGSPGVQVAPPGQPGMPPGHPGMPPGQPAMPPGHAPGDGHDH
jgi:hypothetical protein